MWIKLIETFVPKVYVPSGSIEKLDAAIEASDADTVRAIVAGIVRR